MKNKKQTKRILAIFLTVALSVGFLPFTGFLSSADTANVPNMDSKIKVTYSTNGTISGIAKLNNASDPEVLGALKTFLGTTLSGKNITYAKEAFKNSGLSGTIDVDDLLSPIGTTTFEAYAFQGSQITAFYNIKDSNKLTFKPNALSGFSGTAFDKTWLKGNVVPKNLLNGASSITSADLTDIDIVRADAFKGTGIGSLTIPSGLQVDTNASGQSPFAGIPNLKNVTFGTTTGRIDGDGTVKVDTIISSKVLKNVSSVQTVKISLPSYGKGYTPPTDYVLGSPTNGTSGEEKSGGYVYIDAEAFYGTTNLSRIDIPAAGDMDEIGNFYGFQEPQVGVNAFVNTPNLTIYSSINQGDSNNARSVAEMKRAKGGLVSPSNLTAARILDEAERQINWDLIKTSASLNTAWRPNNRTQNEVTNNLNLPTTISALGQAVEVIWSTTGPVSASGIVIRPNIGSGAASSTLTATLRVNNAAYGSATTRQKTIEVKVLEKDAADYKEAVISAVNAVNWDLIKASNTNQNGVVYTLNLPTSLQFGSYAYDSDTSAEKAEKKGRFSVDITWSSNDTAVSVAAKDAGAVTRPAKGSPNAVVYLTAKIVSKDKLYTDTVTIPVTVLAIGAVVDSGTGSENHVVGTLKADGKLYNGDTPIVNKFVFDGTYTYYAQFDSTPARGGWNYHPDTRQPIYFDGNGHELFNQWADLSSAGVMGTYYFGNEGYFWKNTWTYRNNNPVYLNNSGVLEHNGWFSDGRDLGYANADGSLVNSQWSYDSKNRPVYLHWNGMVARGLITDGIWYYHLDLTDGHIVGQFQ
ncbi:hypothetical protein FACS1894111_04690 [Clostridia bacterium]|nr:hypothetical protein FACS1894111_04690 [Clostridia bacterium]